MNAMSDNLTFSQFLIGCIVIILSELIIAFSKDKFHWLRKDKKSFETQMSDAIAAVTLYYCNREVRFKNDAIVKMNIVRVRARGNLASMLDNLYFDIDSDECASSKTIRKDLANVIDSYREYSRKKTST